MIRPDEIVTAVGGKVMEGSGVAYLQNARIGQDGLSTFTRASAAWVRSQRAKWTQVPSGTPRYGVVNVDGTYRLGLTLESSGGNGFRFSSVISSTAATSTGDAVWVGASSLSTADTIVSTGVVSMLEGQSAWLFRSGGGSSEHGLYQDEPGPSTQWVGMSAIVERLDSTGFAMRLAGSTTGVAIVDGALDWDGNFVATLSSGASTVAPAYGHVVGLGTGPNGGRAYRVTMSAQLGTPGQNLRATIFPVGTAASTRATYLHHVQFSSLPGQREVMVRPSTAAALRAGETLKVPAVNLAGGPMTLYQENILYGRAGAGAGPPVTSTNPDAVFLALAKGWESTGGSKFVGGGIYNRKGESVSVGSTGEGLPAGARVEQLVSISSAGLLTHQVRVNGGKVYTSRSTDTLTPEQQSTIPSYTFAKDQVLLVNVLARGVHQLDDFRSLFP